MDEKKVENYLKTYIPLVDFIANVLGPNSEVVLNNITNLDHSVFYIRNSKITNRKIGDSASNFVLKFVKEGIPDTTDYLTNYTGKSSKIENLRSSTYFIRLHGDVVGMLCINTDDSIISNLVNNFEVFKRANKVEVSEINLNNKKENQVNTNSITENFNNSVISLAENIISTKESELGVSQEHFNRKDKIDIIASLYNDGYFFLKDAVQTIAQYLGCSTPTVYRYLNQIKRSER